MGMILFLGSGVSYPTKLPGVEELLDSILYGEWQKHTDQLFYPGRSSQSWANDPTDSVQRFLRYIKGLADAAHAKREQEPANYEDLFFLVKQIFDQECGENRNAALESFTDAIRPVIHAFQLQDEQFTGGLSKLAGITELANVLIQSVVRHKLATTATPKGLDLVVELAVRHPVTVVTLNHDLLVERAFNAAPNPILYNDGFGSPDGDIRWFEPDTLNSSGKVRLLKLHGSINWYEMTRKDDPDRRRRAALVLNGDARHCRTSEGEILQNYDGLPLFLTGVGNKIASYNRGIYAEMIFRFHEVLKSSDLMIMSGYGWGDKGINIRLIEWLLGKEERRLFLLHEKPEELTTFTYMRDRLKEKGQLIEVMKWMEDVTSADLDPLIAFPSHPSC